MEFIRRLNSRQKVAWFLPLLASAIHMVGISPLIEFPLNILSLIVYPLGCIVSLKMMHKVSSPEEFNRTVPIDFKFCEICQRKVPNNSKHCLICKICIEGFDHHCRWLNKCIGKSNYRSFICMLLCFAISYGLGLSLSIWATISLRDENVYRLDSHAYLAICLLVISMESFLFLFATHLLCLHAFLKLKKMSTYDLITLMRMKSSKVTADSSISSLRIRNAKLFTVKEEPDNIYSPPPEFNGQDRQATEEKILNKIREEAGLI